VLGNELSLTVCGAAGGARLLVGSPSQEKAMSVPCGTLVGFCGGGERTSVETSPGCTTVLRRLA